MRNIENRHRYNLIYQTYEDKIMTNIMRVLLTTAAISFSHMSSAVDSIVLKYHSNQARHEIHVADGKVVGGKSQGGFAWEVSGGAYDGKNLHVTFTSPQRSGCKSWYTHIYEVNQSGPRMLVNIDKCGDTRTDLNGQHYWDSISRL